jgi:hypothetical protein
MFKKLFYICIMMFIQRHKHAQGFAGSAYEEHAFARFVCSIV